MKKLVVSMWAIFSIALSAHNYYTPITSLPEGNYLGLGGYSTDLGEDGIFASYAEITADAWTISHYMDGEIRTYGAFFNFDENGFFDVTMTYVDESGEEATIDGQGYCRSVQCHYALNFGDYILEETVSFITWEDKIYWIGSLRPHGHTDTLNDDDDNNDHPDMKITWEGAMARLEN